MKKEYKLTVDNFVNRNIKLKELSKTELKLVSKKQLGEIKRRKIAAWKKLILKADKKKLDTTKVKVGK